MLSCSEAAFGMFLYLCVCVCMKMWMCVHMWCPYFKEVISICSVWLFCEVVFFWTLLSDPCPQTFISFGFWKPAWMDLTGPCKAEIGEEVLRVQQGCWKARCCLRTFPTKFACGVDLWVGNARNFMWSVEMKTWICYKSKDPLKKNAGPDLCSN